MIYDVQLAFKTISKKRTKFKHLAELGGSNMQVVLNDFIDLYIKNNLQPGDVKKLTVNGK